MKKTFSIKQAFKFGWTAFKAQWTFYIAIIFVALVASWVGGVIGNLLGESFIPQAFATVIAMIIQLFISVGFITIFIRTVREKSVGWNDFLRNKDRLLSFFAVSIIYQILVLIGLILLIIPGIYLAIRYQYATYIIIDDKHISIGKAFKRSAEITKGIKWRIILLACASVGVGILGLLALGVGIFAAAPVIGIARAFVYVQLRKAYHDDFIVDGHTKMIEVEDEEEGAV
ncbi:MAG: DUF975 family protein [Candidatus Pacebacteria bacterium]|nr:DUF975 family protein [Candidatus Paceibacterota bacterium]